MGNGYSSARGHRGLDLTDASPLENLAGVIEKHLDPFGVTTSIINAQAAWLTHPQELAGDDGTFQRHPRAADACHASCDGIPERRRGDAA